MSTGALVRLARSMSASLEQFARELESAEVENAEHDLEEQPLADPEEGRALGTRQKQIVRIAALANDNGLKTADIAKQIDNPDVPNTYLALRAMERSGLVELIPGSEPQRWRLALRYRATADPYLRIAAVVQRGEWTTYGDISIAHRGDSKAARAVGRAAATLDNFPYPHRVLSEGGIIPSGWHDAGGKGPNECRRRLERDGVKFTEDGRASPVQRVAWDELKRRLVDTNGHGRD